MLQMDMTQGHLQQGSTSHSTHYIGHFRDDFTGHMTQPIVSQHWRTIVSRPAHVLISPDSAHEKVKVEAVSKKAILKKCCNQNFLLYIALLRPKTQRHSEVRELNQARSKTDTVDRPVGTARTFVHHYNSTHYCSTETVLLIFIFLQTNITSQM